MLERDDATDEERALRRAACDDPENDVPRLRLAEYFTARKDPRGEFIRLQCARAVERGPGRFALEDRITKLCKEHRALFESAPGFTPAFRRGLLDAVVLERTAVTEAHFARLEREPVRELDLVVGRERDLEPLWSHTTLLSRLRTLRLRGTFGAATCARLAECEHLGALRRLSVSGSAVDPVGVEALARSRTLPSVVSLALSGVTAGDQGITALAASPLLDACELLFLSATDVGDEGVAALAQSPRVVGLRTLALSGNEGLTNVGLRALAESTTLGCLEVLELSGCEIDPQGLEALAASTTMLSLRRVQHRVWISDAAARATIEARFGRGR